MEAHLAKKTAGAGKKAASKKKGARRRGGKVPDMKDVLAQHNKVTKAEKVYRTSHAIAAARKKEWEGAQADLGMILEDIRKGQTKLDFPS